MAVINTNIAALTAERNLNTTQGNLYTSIQRLSSGLRINTAADDAAGLAISEALQAQISGTKQAIRNGQDGISMIQTGEGALNETHAILQRMRELAVEAANGDLNSTDRNAIQLELSKLVQSMDSISQNTVFNGLNLLNGNLAVTYAIGSATITSTAPTQLSIANINLSGAQAGTAYTFTVCAAAGTATLSTPTVSQTVSVRAMIANDSQVISFNALGVSIQVNSTSALAASQVVSDITGSFSTSAANAATTLQIGANSGLSNASNELTVNFVEVDSKTLNLATPDVSTTVGAGQLITTLDTAIDYVSTQRATLGAQENALQHTITNLNVAAENLTASESRIRDLDIAAETVTFTKNQILQQAGTAVLAQANTLPQSVLQLLR